MAHLEHVLLLLTLLLTRIRADVDAWGVITNYSNPSDKCTSNTQLGMATFCCTGQCYDNTFIENPGLCIGFDDRCTDIPGGVSCPSTSVYSNSTYGYYDPGLGNCWGGDECQWQMQTYSWDCCPCPDGFVAQHSDPCGNTSSALSTCIGCAADVTPELNPVTNTFVCKDENYLRRACLMGSAYNDYFSAVGLLGNALSVACPANGIESVIETAFGLAMSAVNLAYSPGNHDGSLGAKAGLASAAIGSISALALGASIVIGAPEEIAAGGALELFSQLCTWSGRVFAANTGLSTPLAISTDCSWAGNAYDYMESLFRGAEKRSTTGPDGLTDLSNRHRRSNNPCWDYLALFPDSSKAFEHFQNSYENLGMFESADTFDANIAKSYTSLNTQLYQVDSEIYNLYLFGQHLSTLAAFAPYCDSENAGNSSASMPDQHSLTIESTTSSTISMSNTPNTSSGNAKPSTQLSTISSSTTEQSHSKVSSPSVVATTTPKTTISRPTTVRASSTTESIHSTTQMSRNGMRSSKTSSTTPQKSTGKSSSHTPTPLTSTTSQSMQHTKPTSPSKQISKSTTHQFTSSNRSSHGATTTTKKNSTTLTRKSSTSTKGMTQASSKMSTSSSRSTRMPTTSRKSTSTSKSSPTSISTRISIVA